MMFVLLSAGHVMEIHDYVLAENELQGLAGDKYLYAVLAGVIGSFPNAGDDEARDAQYAC